MVQFRLAMVTRSRIELLLPPWKGGVLTAWPTGLVAGIGLEPMTYRVWTGCSSQLSYPAKITNAWILYHTFPCLSTLFFKKIKIFCGFEFSFFSIHLRCVIFNAEGWFGCSVLLSSNTRAQCRKHRAPLHLYHFVCLKLEAFLPQWLPK